MPVDTDPAQAERDTSGALTGAAGFRRRLRTIPRVTAFEHLPDEGSWTYLIGPDHRRWVEIGDAENLNRHLVLRQERRPTFDLFLWCLIKGAHAEDLSREFEAQRGPLPSSGPPIFAVTGALRDFMKENCLPTPIALPRPDDSSIHGMPAWVYYRHLND